MAPEDDILDNGATPDTPETGDSVDTGDKEPVSVIELIVEDGNLVEGANSYVSLEEATAYQRRFNRQDWLGLSEDEKKASLIKATQYVDNQFTWKGRRKYQTQELGFPRVMLLDLDGFEVTGIPARLKQAICEAAYYGYQTDLFQTYESEQGIIKRNKERVEGAVEKEVEYFNTKETAVDYISKYAALNSLLRGFYIDRNSGKSVNCRALWSY
nr:MAG TPA: Putative Head Tail Connector Protein [Caudoviricetes sp.]